MSVREDLAVNTITDSQITSSTADINIFAFINCNSTTYGCHEYCAIRTLLNLQTIHVDSNVYVRVFATYNAYIFSRWLISHIPNGNTLIQECNILRLVH